MLPIPHPPLGSATAGTSTCSPPPLGSTGKVQRTRNPPLDATSSHLHDHTSLRHLGNHHRPPRISLDDLLNAVSNADFMAATATATANSPLTFDLDDPLTPDGPDPLAIWSAATLADLALALRVSGVRRLRHIECQTLRGSRWVDATWNEERRLDLGKSSRKASLVGRNHCPRQRQRYPPGLLVCCAVEPARQRCFPNSNTNTHI
jgi:hypothetical protein